MAQMWLSYLIWSGLSLLKSFQKWLDESRSGAEMTLLGTRRQVEAHLLPPNTTI